MEDDGERAELLQSILDLLLARGYLRARISALSAFDKLTGGLAWCITFSKVDVDFDIFYDDDGSLYYKIKVGEAIEEALQRMGCPHPLQAHQIQGLDYKAVLPVVQWLVKRVLATLEEFGDQARRYAHLQYQKNYKPPSESLLQDARLDKIEAALRTSVQEPVRKALDAAKLDSLSDSVERSLDTLPIKNAAPVLYSESSFTDESKSIEVMEESLQGLDVSEKEKEVHNQQVQNLLKHIGAHNLQIPLLQSEADAVVQSLIELEQTVSQQDEFCSNAQAAIDALQIAAKTAGSETLTLQKLMDVLERSKALAKQEADFRAECYSKRAEMQAHLKQQKEALALAPEDDQHSIEVNNAYILDLQKWSALRTELSKKNQAVALLQRRLGDMPSQSELMQYERRFVELYLHIQRKFRETRKYYATYNALAEAQELTVKEQSLLTSIHSQFEVAMMIPGGRLKFVESMEEIAKGVQQKFRQIERRFEAEQSTHTALKEKHTAAVVAQRQYYAIVKQFQGEYARSEKLQSRSAATSQPRNQIQSAAVNPLQSKSAATSQPGNQIQSAAVNPLQSQSAGVNPLQSIS